jgi:hypothetical protein
MRVFEDHQYRSAARKGFELIQQSFEQLLTLALRAQIEISGGIWQRQQLCQQLGLVIAAGIRREQRAQLPELPIPRVVAREPGGAFELSDEGVERAVLMVWRAEISYARMLVGLDGL